MRSSLICSAVLCLLVADVNGDSADGQLSVHAAAAEVAISAAAAGKRVLALPGMEYRMQIETICSDELLADSLSISVADSRVRLDAVDLAAKKPLEKSIRIPASQIAPLAIENFCIVDGDTTSGESTPQAIRVPDVLSAQVSLRCASEERQVMIYQTLALEVALRCELPIADAPEGD